MDINTQNGVIALLKIARHNMEAKESVCLLYLQKLGELIEDIDTYSDKHAFRSISDLLEEFTRDLVVAK